MRGSLRKCAGALSHIKPLLLRWTDKWWGGVITEMRPPELLERPECARASGSGLGPVDSSGESDVDLLRPVLGQKCNLPSAFPACHEWTIRCCPPSVPRDALGPRRRPRGAEHHFCPLAVRHSCLVSAQSAEWRPAWEAGRLWMGMSEEVGVSQWEIRNPRTTGGYIGSGEAYVADASGRKENHARTSRECLQTRVTC